MTRPRSVDTSYLIDLQRERAQATTHGPAYEFLRSRLDMELQVSAIALGEFAEGSRDPDHPVL